MIDVNYYSGGVIINLSEYRNKNSAMTASAIITDKLQVLTTADALTECAKKAWPEIVENIDELRHEPGLHEPVDELTGQ